MTQTTTDDPLTAALLRLLKKPQIEFRKGRPQYDAGSWGGRCKELFSDLIDDEKFYAAADRPHDAADLRGELRKRAVELHKFGIIITLDGQSVSIERTK